MGPIAATRMAAVATTRRMSDDVARQRNAWMSSEKRFIEFVTTRVVACQPYQCRIGSAYVYGSDAVSLLRIDGNSGAHCGPRSREWNALGGCIYACRNDRGALRPHPRRRQPSQPCLALPRQGRLRGPLKLMWIPVARRSASPDSAFLDPPLSPKAVSHIP